MQNVLMLFADPDAAHKAEVYANALGAATICTPNELSAEAVADVEARFNVRWSREGNQFIDKRVQPNIFTALAQTAAAVPDFWLYRVVLVA